MKSFAKTSLYHVDAVKFMKMQFDLAATQLERRLSPLPLDAPRVCVCVVSAQCARVRVCACACECVLCMFCVFVSKCLIVLSEQARGVEREGESGSD